MIFKKPSFLTARAGLPQESAERIQEITLTMYKKHHSPQRFRFSKHPRPFSTNLQSPQAIQQLSGELKHGSDSFSNGIIKHLGRVWKKQHGWNISNTVLILTSHLQTPRLSTVLMALLNITFVTLLGGVGGGGRKKTNHDTKIQTLWYNSTNDKLFIQ